MKGVWVLLALVVVSVSGQICDTSSASFSVCTIEGTNDGGVCTISSLVLDCLFFFFFFFFFFAFAFAFAFAFCFCFCFCFCLFLFLLLFFFFLDNFPLLPPFSFSFLSIIIIMKLKL